MPDLSIFSKKHLDKLHEGRFLCHRYREVDAVLRAKEALPPVGIVEVGSNRGRFLCALAQADPERHVLGLEWRGKWVNDLRKTRNKRELANLHCLHADARIALPLLIEPSSLEQLFVLYPDPWW